MRQTHGTWGDRRVIFRNDTCLVTILDLQPCKRCSWHKHQTAFNRFHVLRGSLIIKTEIGETFLGEKSTFDVKPGLMHEFRTLNSPARVLEIAYTQYDESDIERDLLGGDYETE